MCNHLWLDGDQEMCLALLLMFEMYLRPGEITKLRAVDLVPPVKKSQVHKFFTVVVAPAEVGDPTKTGEFDNALHLDLPRHQLLGPALELTMV